MRPAWLLVGMLVIGACSPETAEPPPSQTTTTEVVVTTTAEPTVCPGDERGNAEPGGVSLNAYRLSDGEHLWKTSVSSTRPARSPQVTAAASSLLVTDGNSVWALDAATCQRMWGWCCDRIESLAVLAPDRVALSSPSTLTVVEAQSGSTLWTATFDTPLVTRPPRAALVGAVVVVTTPTMTLAGFDAASGEQAFSVEVTSDEVALFANAGTAQQFFVTYGSTIEARHPATGGLMWRADVGFHTYPGMAATQETVYVTSAEDATIAALGTASGTRLWQRTVDERAKFLSPVLVVENELHLFDTKHRLHRLDAADGATLALTDHGSLETLLIAAHQLMVEQHHNTIDAWTTSLERAWTLDVVGEPADAVYVVGEYAITVTTMPE